MDRRRGFTLPELVFTMALAAGLLAWGIPNFREFRLNSARTREVNQFIQAVYFARSEAMKRNTVVSLCPSLDGASCAPAGSPWQTGWLVFVNLDRDQPAVRDPGEPLLHVYPAWTDGSISSNRPTLSLRPFGQLAITATVTFCDVRGSNAARAVIISQTGRPRVAERSASNKPLGCP